MAAFYLYADESGKLSGKTDYTSLCGYVGHSTEWERFSLEWNNLWLKWQIPAVHMSRVMSPDSKQDAWTKKKQEWGDLWEDKRDTMLSELALAIQQANIICIGAVVDANAYRQVRQDQECLLTEEDSNVFAFHEVIMRTIERVETVDRCSPISLVVDDDADTAMGYYSSFNNLKTHFHERFKKVRDRIHGICFCNDASYPGLQAADMIAYESRRVMIERASNPKAEPSLQFARLTHGGMYQPKFYTGEILNKLGRNVANAVRRGNNEAKE